MIAPAALRHFVKGDTPTFLDFYCGIGGSSSGLVEAGFTPTYRLLGTKGQQQLGAGNAVPVNVAHWIGRQVLEVLTRSAVAA